MNESLEQQKILEHLEFIEPLLRAAANAEIDASKLLSEVADELVTIGERANVGARHASPLQNLDSSTQVTQALKTR
jgi:hypothetical protein